MRLELSPKFTQNLKTTLIRNNPYDERIRRLEDCELLNRILSKATVYSVNSSVSLVNTKYSSASKARRNISEDYLGHLDLNKGGFWYKMCVCRTFIEEREHYKEDTKRLYPRLYKRYELLLMMKILDIINKLQRKIGLKR